MGYSVYYSGEVKISPPLSDKHASLVTALLNREQGDETDAIFAAFTAQPEQDVTYHTGLLSISEDRQLLLPEEDESRHGVGLWLRLLVDHVFLPHGYELHGEISWEGEDRDDSGTIYLKQCELECVDDLIFNAGPSWARNHFVDEATKQELAQLVDSADNTGCTPDLTVVDAAHIQSVHSLLAKM